MLRLPPEIFVSILNIELEQVTVVKKAKEDIVQRCATLTDALKMINTIYFPKVSYKIDNNDYLNIINVIKKHILSIDCWDSKDNLKTFITNFCVQNNIELNTVWSILRLLLTGQEYTPNVCNIMYALGKDICISRILNE